MTSISARTCSTIVYVQMAHRANKSANTLTMELVDSIHTGATVKTWIIGTVIHVGLTTLSGKTRLTYTPESIIDIDALAMTATRVSLAHTDPAFAVGAGEPLRARAPVPLQPAVV